MRLRPAALRTEARRIIASPMIKAITGLAWCAGTGSFEREEGDDEAEVAVAVIVSM